MKITVTSNILQCGTLEIEQITGPMISHFIIDPTEKKVIDYLVGLGWSPPVEKDCDTCNYQGRALRVCLTRATECISADFKWWEPIKPEVCKTCNDDKRISADLIPRNTYKTLEISSKKRGGKQGIVKETFKGTAFVIWHERDKCTCRNLKDLWVDCPDCVK